MKSVVAAGLLLAWTGVLPLSSAQAAPHIVPQNVRDRPVERSIQVVVAQNEVIPSIRTVYTVSVNGFGGGGGGAEVRERYNRGEIMIAPIRRALADFNVDNLAMNTTRNTVARIDWLHAVDVSLSKSRRLEDSSVFPDNRETPETVFFDYTYDFSPEFASARVTIHLQISSSKQPPKKEGAGARIKPNKILYAQSVTSIVPLPIADKNPNVNVQRWAADDGKLARAALTLAFSNAEHLMVRALSVTDAEYKAIKGYRGFPVDPNDPSGDRAVVVTGPGFYQVEMLPQAQ